MTINELIVASEEQTLTLLNGYSADIKFDPYHKRWYYNLYKDRVLVYAGLALVPNSLPLHGISEYSLGLVDKLDDKQRYEPFNELGSRLGLVEVTE